MQIIINISPKKEKGVRQSMGTNKTYEERIKAQKDIMEKAAAKIKELEEAAAKKEEEKKQKKIESILKDIEKALSDSPILSCNKKSEEYKQILELIKTGKVIPDSAVEQASVDNIYTQIGKLAEDELGRPLQEGDQTYFKTFIADQDARGNYFRKAFRGE